MNDPVIRCALSGSYRRYPLELRRAYLELVTCGCQVLSPHRIDFVDTQADFVKDVAEQDWKVEDIERHHLLAIDQANFVWLFAPDGYVGLSAAFEVGYAVSKNIPIFSRHVPQEEVLRSFVTSVSSVFDALSTVGAKVWK